MNIIPFDHGKHMKDLLIMCKAHNIPRESVLDLPQFGLIAYENKESVACCFIRKMEGNHALLEGYITNPTQPGDVRNRALDLLTKLSIRTCLKNNINILVAFTKEDTIIKRAVNHGFSLTPYQVLSNKLT